MIALALLFLAFAGAYRAMRYGTNAQKLLGVVPVGVALLGYLPPVLYSVLNPHLHLKPKFMMLGLGVTLVGAIIGGVFMAMFKPAPAARPTPAA